MPTKSYLAGLLLLAGVTTSCDTTQPLQVDRQTVELRFSGSGAPRVEGNSAGIQSFDTWFYFEDGDLDLTTDDPIDDAEYLWCEDISPRDTHVSPSSVPWSYTLQISVIRAGERTATVVSSPPALVGGPSVNLTAYDGANVNDVRFSTKDPVCLDATGDPSTECTVCEFNQFRPCGKDSQCLDLNEGLCVVSDAVTRMFRFTDNTERKLSRATRVVAQALDSPLVDAVPAFGIPGQGRCSLQDPGPTVIDGESTFTLEINKGDTIIVEARRGDDAPPGLPVNGSVSDKVKLNATFRVDGRISNVSGNDVTDSSPGAGMKFTFTSR